ncbi:MAG: TetR/AcrR family transcriptional regulator [Bacteroidota bacterium]
MSPKTKEQYEEIRQKSAEAILQAALELFGHQGYHSTTISQIAKAAGVSKGLMYNYFPSKEALLDEIIHGVMAVGEELMTLLEGPGSPGERLRKLLLNNIEMLKSNLHFWKLITSLSFQPEVVERYSDLIRTKARANLKVVEELFRQKGSPNPRREALMLSATLDGIFLHYLNLREDYPLEEMVNHLIEQFCSE